MHKNHGDTIVVTQLSQNLVKSFSATDLHQKNYYYYYCYYYCYCYCYL